MSKASDQIELFETLTVLWKYKFMILAGTLICIIAVGIFSSMQPQKYRVEMVILPGEISAPKSGRPQYIDSSHNIKTMIQQGVLRKRMLGYLEETPIKSFNFTVSIPRKSDIIKISSEAKNVDSGIAALNALSAALSDYYVEKREFILNELNNDLEVLNSRLYTLNLKEAATQKRIEIISSMLTESTKKSDDPNASGKQTLQTVELSKLLDEAQIDLVRIREEKNRNINEAAFIEQKKEQIKYIQILKPPKSSKNPITPNIKIKLMGAAFAGLLLMIILSFFIEQFRNLIQKHLDKKANQNTDEE